MTRDRLGLYMIGFAAVTSIIIPAAVDFNESHLFNPDWPGHARLHDAMSIIMSIGLGLGALWLIRDPARRKGGLLWLAVSLSVWSWVSLIAGGLIPGATYTNASEDIPAPTLFGITIWINAAIAWVVTLIGIAGGLFVQGGRRRPPRPRLTPSNASES